MIFVLIGMPGCGKSCMGRGISGRLKMKVIDGDRLIERRYGNPLYKLIEENGLDGFKKIEEETLLSIEDDNVIIAPGGSAVYYDSVMKYFKSRGKIIYLYASLETIRERLGDYSKRGVVLAPDQTLESLYEERCKLYRKYADITINCDGNFYTRYQAITIRKIKAALRDAEEIK